MDRLGDLNNEKQARLEIPSQNRKDLQSQVAGIKQTLEKALDRNTSLSETIRTFFRKKGIIIVSILTVFSMTISTTVLAITGVFGGGGATRNSAPKDKGILKKMVRQASKRAQKTCRKGR